MRKEKEESQREFKRGYGNLAAVNASKGQCLRCGGRFGSGERCGQCGIHRDRRVGKAHFYKSGIDERKRFLKQKF